MTGDRWGFNQWASSYDEDIIEAARSGDWMFGDYNRVLDKVVEYAELDGNSYTTVLDIGIGTGNLAVRFITRGMQVVGIDPSVEMRKICHRKYPDIKVMAGDFLKIPRSLQQFDVILSAYAFHHLTASEKAKAIPVMKRHLKPGGRIIIADLMFQNAIEESRIKRDLREAGRDDILERLADEYPGDYEALAQLFQKEGFSVDGERLTESVWIIRACL
jgi:putative AdoMet-dependent methyltransferase